MGVAVSGYAGAKGAIGATGATGATGSNATILMSSAQVTTDLGVLSSTSYADLTGATVTFDPGASVNADVDAFASYVHGGATLAVFFRTVLDGTLIAGSEKQCVTVAGLTSNYDWHGKVALTSGSRTLKVQYKVTSTATAAINGTTGAGGAGIAVVYPVT